MHTYRSVTDWKCDCGLINYRQRERCYDCKGHRPDSLLWRKKQIDERDMEARQELESEPVGRRIAELYPRMRECLESERSAALRPFVALLETAKTLAADRLPPAQDPAETLASAFLDCRDIEDDYRRLRPMLDMPCVAELEARLILERTISAFKEGKDCVSILRNGRRFILPGDTINRLVEECTGIRISVVLPTRENIFFWIKPDKEQSRETIARHRGPGKREQSGRARRAPKRYRPA